jgi:phosphoglycerate-specific signal transduction histidine kinase
MQLPGTRQGIATGEPMASMAHEVKQPIAAMLTNAQAALRWLYLERPNLDEARQALARTVKDVNRANGMISRIDDLPR